MKASVLIVLTAIVLLVVSILATMNNSCKSSRHGWCAPMSALRQDIKLEPTEQYSHPFNGPVVERVMPVAEVRLLCTAQGASPRGVACSWGERWHLLSCFTERWTGARFDLPPTRNRPLQRLAGEPSPRIDNAYR
jgi:hypothetical protein